LCIKRVLYLLVGQQLERIEEQKKTEEKMKFQSEINKTSGRTNANVNMMEGSLIKV
jgi:hypothetical protein